LNVRKSPLRMPSTRGTNSYSSYFASTSIPTTTSVSHIQQVSIQASTMGASTSTYSQHSEVFLDTAWLEPGIAECTFCCGLHSCGNFEKHTLNSFLRPHTDPRTSWVFPRNTCKLPFVPLSLVRAIFEFRPVEVDSCTDAKCLNESR
jgi:hypothetical protein